MSSYPLEMPTSQRTGCNLFGLVYALEGNGINTIPIHRWEGFGILGHTNRRAGLTYRMLTERVFDDSGPLSPCGSRRAFEEAESAKTFQNRSVSSAAPDTTV